MPQRFQDSGKIIPIRIYQTIATSGDLVEGTVTLTSTESNNLEIVAQSWRQVFIEGRNDGSTNTADQKIYGTRKFNLSVPDTGDSFWDVTADHWEVVDTQPTIAVSTNSTPVTLVDKGYTYLVVTGLSASGTTFISRAVLTA